MLAGLGWCEGPATSFGDLALFHNGSASRELSCRLRGNGGRKLAENASDFPSKRSPSIRGIDERYFGTSTMRRKAQLRFLSSDSHCPSRLPYRRLSLSRESFFPRHLDQLFIHQPCALSLLLPQTWRPLSARPSAHPPSALPYAQPSDPPHSDNQCSSRCDDKPRPQQQRKTRLARALSASYGIARLARRLSISGLLS